ANCGDLRDGAASSEPGVVAPRRRATLGQETRTWGMALVIGEAYALLVLLKVADRATGLFIRGRNARPSLISGGTAMGYHLEGRLLEVCNCRVLCPCWIGEDPDFGTCDTIVAWHFDKGKIDNVDVGGTTIAMIAHVPGNI